MLSAGEKYGDGSGSGVTVNNNWNCGCCCGGGGVTDHEKLDNLMGGDETGHMHLTPEEHEALLKMIEEELGPKPEWTEFDGGWASTTEAEYEANKDHWLDGGDAAGGQMGEVDGGEA